MERLIVPANLELLDKVTDFVEQMLSAASFSNEKKLQVRLVVEEIFVNIASYSFPEGEGEAEILCELLPDPMRIRITFSSGGVPFNPLDKEEADTSKEALMAREGGLGILLIRRMSDKVSYRFTSGKNVLTVEKNR